MGGMYVMGARQVSTHLYQPELFKGVTNQTGLLPHFLAKTAVTRELYDLIAEVRPKSSVNQLVENIHCQF